MVARVSLSIDGRPTFYSLRLPVGIQESWTRALILGRYATNWLYLGRFSTDIPSMDVTVLVSSQLDLASI